MKSKNWLQRQKNDIYVKKAKNEGYLSRSAYKLIQIDNKYKILKKSNKILELGSAPGGWSQVICNINQKVYSSIESFENKIFIQVSDGSLRAYTIKKNGNPDELWNRPFFTGENDKRNNENWDPVC